MTCSLSVVVHAELYLVFPHIMIRMCSIVVILHRSCGCIAQDHLACGLHTLSTSCTPTIPLTHPHSQPISSELANGS